MPVCGDNSVCQMSRAPHLHNTCGCGKGLTIEALEGVVTSIKRHVLKPLIHTSRMHAYVARVAYVANRSMEYIKKVICNLDDILCINIKADEGDAHGDLYNQYDLLSGFKR